MSLFSVFVAVLFSSGFVRSKKAMFIFYVFGLEDSARLPAIFALFDVQLGCSVHGLSTSYGTEI